MSENSHLDYSLRAQEVFKSIYRLSEVEFGRFVTLVANDESLLSSILDKSEAFQRLVAVIKADAEKTDELIRAVDSLAPKIGVLTGLISHLQTKISTRNRKSSPATVKRNIDICDLRKSDPRKWSQGRLAKHYRVTPRQIRKILSEEDKWRKLAAAMGIN